MITPQNNPMITSPTNPYGVLLSQTKESLLDSDIYLRFIRSAQGAFRRSQFYRDYKSDVMNKGIYRDQRHASITSEMVDLEMHHNFISLEFMAIMITEYYLNHKGCINEFELQIELEEAHRRHEVCVIMMNETDHQVHHSDPTDFISIRQCWGFPFKFIDRFIDGMTLDIAMKLLLHLKQEEQYGESHSINIVKARERILSWQQETIEQKRMFPF